VRSASELIARLEAGERRAVGRLITWAERSDPRAVEVFRLKCRELGHAYVVGVTGAPGSGKSTLTNALCLRLLDEGLKVGVIAVDPTSPFSGGAILGDRVRLNELATHPRLFIRSMGTRGHLGGLSKATSMALRALDLSGCDVIFIETVGVGQSEVDVMRVCHTTLMVMVPGLGDDIQAIKAGVMEVGDVFVVNQADRDGARRTAREVNAMLDLSHSDWRPPVKLASALKREGLEELWEALGEHRAYMEGERGLQRRVESAEYELLALAQERLTAQLKAGLSAQTAGADLKSLATLVAERALDPYSALERLMGAQPSP